MAEIYYCERIQSKISKEKRIMGWCPRKPGTSFQASCPSRATQDMLNSPSDLWQLWNVIYQGTSLETWCLRLFVGANDIGILCLAVNKIPDTQEESRCSAEVMFFAQFRPREPLSKFPDASLVSRPSGIILGLALLTLFCISIRLKIFN